MTVQWFNNGNNVNIGTNSTVANTSTTSSSNGVSSTSTTAEIAPGTTYSNGVIVLQDYGEAGKYLIKAKDATGKIFYIDGNPNAAGGFPNPEEIPQGVIDSIKPNTLITKFDTPFNGYWQGSTPPPYYGGTYGSPYHGNTLVNLAFPELNGAEIPLAILDTHPDGSEHWYSYKKDLLLGGTSYQYVNTTVAPFDQSPWDEAPYGRKHVNLTKSSIFNVPGAMQTFTTLAEAQAFVAANPGATLTAQSTQGPPILLNNIKASELQQYLNDGYVIVGSPVTTTIATGVKEGSTQYNDLVTQGYTPTENGSTTTVIIPEKKYDDITYEEAQKIKGEHPNAVITKDGHFAAGESTYKYEYDIVKDSQKYKDLLAAGWVATANGKFKEESYTTSKTVHLQNIAQSELYKYENLPGFKKVANTTTTPGGSQSVTLHGGEAGWWADALELDDTSVGNFNADNLENLFDGQNSEQYKVSGLFEDDNDISATGDHTFNGPKMEDGYYAGDPGMGTDKNGYAWTESHPALGIRTALEATTDTPGDFKVILNQQIGDIGDNKVAATAYGMTVTYEGETTKIKIEDGQVLINGEPLALGETFQIGPADKPLLKISERTVPGAGYQGAPEQRWGIDLKLPLDSAAKQNLISQGATAAEVANLTTEYEFNFANREINGDNDADGAYGNSMGYGDTTPPSCDGPLDRRYYDAHLNIKRSCVTITSSTECTTYDVCYDEECTETKKTPLYDFKMEVPGECKEKYDVCVPPETKTEKCFDFKDTRYNLKKDTQTDSWKVTLPGFSGFCLQPGNTNSPLALNLNGDGILTETRSNNPFKFDLNNDGKVESYSSWFKSSSAILGVDMNADGQLNNGGEMFGNHTAFVGDTPLNNGYDALRAFANKVNSAFDDDDKISTDELDDLENAGLVASVNGEIKKLSELGVTELSLDTSGNGYVEASGAILNPVSSATVNGQKALFADAWFTPDEETQATTADSTQTTTSADVTPNTIGNRITALKEQYSKLDPASKEALDLKTQIDNLAKQLENDSVSDTSSKQTNAASLSKPAMDNYLLEALSNAFVNKMVDSVMRESYMPSQYNRGYSFANPLDVMSMGSWYNRNNLTASANSNTMMNSFMTSLLQIMFMSMMPNMYTASTAYTSNPLNTFANLTSQYDEPQSLSY